ncbi:MAG: hypothetical protein IJ747_06555 [Lachnospiraceae bacterium]|nr:hypothetical protein [Lachnospiraceae bacterium]
MSPEPMNEKEYRSSGWALLLVGGVGLLGVALGISGVLPVHLGNPYLFYGVMMSVFVLFIVMGALSFKSARIFAQKEQADHTLMETVETWCVEHLTAEEIDRAVDADLPDETASDPQLLFFPRAEYIKEKINNQFMNLDQKLLDRYVDERLYDLIFGEKT